MILTRASLLDAPADEVWDALQLASTFAYVTHPVLRFPAAEQRDVRWSPGLEMEDRVLLFGFVPLGRHHIRIESVDEPARRMQTRESGGLVRTWDHEIRVEVADEGRCRYSDRLEIEAGALTLLVGLMAWLLFRYRHYRWHRLVTELTQPSRQR